MTLVVSISRRILKEIDSQAKDPVVKELAKAILEFEMENWKLEKVHFKEYFDKLISIQSRKRLPST
jgi:hypothetical protein